MAETAKKAADEKNAAKKGRARKNKTTKNPVDEQTSNEPAQAADTVDSIREQIENCKNELAASLRQDIRVEYQQITERQVAKANRRRRWNNFFHDLIILALAALVGYFGYCLYDVHYFDFMKTECEKAGNCEPEQESNVNEGAGPVKDATWYLANYSYLLDNIQTKLNPDDLAAYYLYTADHKLEQIRPELLLSMAYNQVGQTNEPEADAIEITEEAMREAFQKTFGSTELLKLVDFTYDCLDFKYNKSNRIFSAPVESCTESRQRRIIEQIERIYEEGEVLYILTTATIFDADDGAIYNFDDLFQPILLNVDESGLGLYTTLFNRYQYQFKKSEDKYYLSSIVKLR